MQNVNKQLGNGSIMHRCSYYKHILVINKVQTYSNVLSIPVKMFFNRLTAWLKPHVKKFKTRLMVHSVVLTVLFCTIKLVLNFFTVEGFLRCGFNHAVIWLKNILTGSKARLNVSALLYLFLKN